MRGREAVTTAAHTTLFVMLPAMYVAPGFARRGAATSNTVTVQPGGTATTRSGVYATLDDNDDDHHHDHMSLSTQTVTYRPHTANKTQHPRPHLA